MWKITFGAVLLVIVLDSVFAKTLPSYLKVCKRNNPNLSRCLLDNVAILKPRFKAGIPDLFIPPMDPLLISQASLNSGESFKATFTDIKVFNVDQFIIKDFEMDLDKNRVVIKISFPKLRIKSDYNINGRLLILSLNGKGAADGNYTNINGYLSLKGTTLKKNNKEYIRWEKEKIDIKIEKIHLYFDRLFGDNEELNEQTNKVVNQNIEAILEDLQPVIQQVVSEILANLLNRVFLKFPINELFPRS